MLVLVDGDGYIFDDHLVAAGAEGGSRAAQLLNDTVRNSMLSRGRESCRIMVRIYANLSGLSKALSRAKLVGADKRSLAPFVANFNRSHDLFDFVDAGELKENADFKVRAMFRQFIDNVQCRHIYFAACHDVGYVSELTPYMGNLDRITLVRTYALHPQFSKLGLRVEDLPDLFRSTPLPQEISVSAAKRPISPTGNQLAPYTSDSGSAASVCQFFQKGGCRYGKTCKYLHVKEITTNGKDNPKESQNKTPFSKTSLGKSNSDSMSWRNDASSPEVREAQGPGANGDLMMTCPC